MHSESSVQIHPAAVVSASAKIGVGTTVGPFTVIGPNVEIGANNIIHSHVVIDGNTTIGDGNQIYQFASIGSAPQDLKFKGEPSRLVIGNNNLIREYVTMQPGTAGGGMLTQVGNNNLFMACSHVAHDVIMGDRNILANSCALAGHIVVESGVIAGGLSGVHQYVRLGELCYIGAGSMVSQDVPPYCLVQGDRAGLVGLNTVGLKRGGVSTEAIQVLRSVYRSLFRVKIDGTTKDGLEKMSLKERATFLLQKAQFDQERTLLNFILNSERGVCGLRLENE